MTVAVVTGASRGIGRATATALAERGVDLALLGRPSDALSTTVATLQQRVRVMAFSCDLSVVTEIERAASEVCQTLGTPDAVVNNAARIVRQSVLETTAAQWDAQMALNLRAPFLVSRAFLPGMLARRSGRLIQIASISATLGTANAAAYGASKWGLVGFMKCLAEELTDTGVTTMALLPGSVDTEMLAGSGFTPRMTAADVAQTIVFHCLDAPAAHNGGIVELFGV